MVLLGMLPGPVQVVVELCVAVHHLAQEHRDLSGNLDALLSEVDTMRMILELQSGASFTAAENDTVTKMEMVMREIKGFIESVVSQPKVVKVLKASGNNRKIAEYKEEVFRRYGALTAAMTAASRSAQQQASGTDQSILASSAPRLRAGRTTAATGIDVEAIDTELPEWDISWVAHMTSGFSEAKRIAKGGSSSVFLASVSGRAYAVKVARRDDELRLSSGKYLLQREADIMNRLDHRFVGTMVATSVGHASGFGEVICIVMDFWPGGSLTQRLGVVHEPQQRVARRHGLLRWQARMRVLWQLATTLEYLHTCKPYPILHHDLKPDNVMLDSKSENPSIRLIDFGGSKVEIAERRKKKTTVSRTEGGGS